MQETSTMGQSLLDRCSAVRSLNKIPSNDIMLVVQLSSGIGRMQMHTYDLLISIKRLLVCLDITFSQLD